MTNIFVLPTLLGAAAAMALCVIQRFRSQRPIASALLIALLVGMSLFIVDWRANAEQARDHRLFFSLLVFGIAFTMSFVSAVIVAGVVRLCRRSS
jgi:hypothetical protein